MDTRRTNAVYSFAKDGFIMSVPNHEEHDGMELKTLGTLFALRYMIIENNVIVDRNMNKIKSLEAIRDEVGSTKWVWKDTIAKEIKKHNIISKVKNSENKYTMMLNPIVGCHSTINDNLYFSFREEILKYYYLFYDRLIDKNSAMDFINSIDDEMIKANVLFRISNDEYKVLDLADKGIYILYDGDEIVYIGKSTKSIKGRLNDHKKDKVFDSVKCIKFKHESNIDLYEPYLINLYKPKYNRDLISGKVGISLPRIVGI